MNLTIAALSLSNLVYSPLISPASYTMKPLLAFENSKMQYFFTSFIKDHSLLADRKIIYCSFMNFLDAAISIVGAETGIVKKQTFYNFTYYDWEYLTIIGCIFKNIDHPEDSGGAIEYKSENKGNGYVSLYESTFENCSSSNNNGGAICVYKKKEYTGYDSTHTMTTSFNSSYCCYYGCSAYLNNETNENNTKGYGSVMFIFAENIEIFYSSSVECPPTGDSFGAQFDLFSNTIKSSYINASSASSKYCSAMEYRNAQEGYFTFQTFINLRGGFMSSFTNLKDTEKIEMSYCNFYNNTIRKLDNQQSSIIYVRKCTVYLSHFCFVDTNLDNGSNFAIVRFVDETRPVHLYDSIMDDNIKSYLKDVNTINVSFYADNTVKYTNTIKLLNLRSCQGELVPPPTIFSSIFTPSQVFTYSKDFSESAAFSPSDKFTKSKEFTKSNTFSASKSFTPSITFSPSSKFSSSKSFSPSSKFSASKSFTPSITFSPSKKFTPSNRFTSSNSFTQSNKFTLSDSFRPTNHFDATHSFTPSNTFTPSAHFTPSNHFTSSNYFTFSDKFSGSIKFTQTDIFTNSNSHKPFSNHFTSSEKFNATAIFDKNPPVDIRIKEEDKENGISSEMKIGIGVTCACVGVIALAAAIFLIRRRKTSQVDFEDEDVEVHEETGSTIVTANPLVTMMNDDDPFEESFQSNASFSQILSNPALNKMPSNASVRSMKSNLSLHKLPSVPGLNDPLANQSIHHMPSSPSVNRINQSPSLHQAGSTFSINDTLNDS